MSTVQKKMIETPRSRRGTPVWGLASLYPTQGEWLEPDVAYFTAKKVPKNLVVPPQGADLVMEVVSPSDESRKRDLIQERRDYAKAGIADYWIVDPEASTITVLALSETKYVQAGRYKFGQKAVSKLLPEFKIDDTEPLTRKPTV